MVWRGGVLVLGAFGEKKDLGSEGFGEVAVLGFAVFVIFRFWPY